MDSDTGFSDREKKLFLIFKMAIESERDAQARYKEAEQYCDDPALKKILQTIGKEEASHEKALVRWYEIIKKRVSDRRASS